MLGQLFLLTCVAASLSIAGILFVLFGPVPVKRSVTVVPRLSAPPLAPATPSLAAQLAPSREQHFTPAFPVPFQNTLPSAPPVAPAPARKPKGQKVQPMQRKRVARGTESPFAPVVRHRNFREEDAATNPVPLVSQPTGSSWGGDSEFNSEEFTTIDD
ncbi:MAG TPA: hypothetical protein VIV40_39145 [Kofleriaceae bacterium]